ncbi:hypothetical protein CN326_21550 [Bacillus sp. AFS018417]|uniref:DUF4365 domain-containing protein n=1 Tax=Bacillus sp. AFS018417 TaxID=2033491 RepID=UPI000BF57169|nr:DUF4365 domain-containing protein [Bacillus sp. AFS018417]PEZ01339.1 hypothetical protein CN326_21550 [Bacillus sp. AFS018417]
MGPNVGNRQVERKGIRLVDEAINEELCWIFREQPTDDYGIDAHLELVENSTATGKLIAIQIKSGESFFKKKNKDGFYFYGEMKHLTYWLKHSLPVILVLCDVKNGICYWEHIIEEKIKRTKSGWKILVPSNQILSFDSKSKLQKIAENQTDYEKRLHKLVMDKAWMNEIKRGNKLVLESEEWINKSSGKGSLTLKIIDEYTEYERVEFSYPTIYFPMMSYKEVFTHLFPWAEISADEDYYEEYDMNTFLENHGIWDNENGKYYYDREFYRDWIKRLPPIRPYENISGEIDRYRLVLEINDIGNAFLLLDNFLNTGAVENKSDVEEYSDDDPTSIF